MSRKLVISLVFAFACAGADTTATPEPAPVPEPPPVASMDPLVVSPAAHTLAFENDQIRVLKASFDPGEESPMHSHPDTVGYILSGGKLDFTTADGAVEHRESVTGQAMFRPATSHSVKNVGDTLVEVAPA